MLQEQNISVNESREEKSTSQDSKTYGGYISQITFNSDETVEIAEDDIVILVGPNNAGKSQSLKDIYNLCYSPSNTKIVKNIVLLKNKDSLERFIASKAPKKYITGSGFRYDFSDVSYHTYECNQYSDWHTHMGFRKFFVSYLTASTRLNIADPAPAIGRGESPQHPIHHAMHNHEYYKWLDKNFKRAFDENINIDILNGNTIPLRIGPTPNLEGRKFNNTTDRFHEYSKIIGDYKQVDQQGDGIRSFTGILLHLMIPYYRTFLIDEPESFLHPPQARIMGQIIAETLTRNQQAFISTHSEDIIKGLLAVAPNRVKIIRITRRENTNKFSILKNEEFNEIWNDPILKYSNIMSSIFHKNAVLCESDADCKIYSIIDNHIKQKNGIYSETMFIHCSGKHRMPNIIKALKSLNVDIKIIADIDLLNDINLIKNVIKSIDDDFDFCEFEKQYRILESNLHSEKENVNKDIFIDFINRISERSKSKEYTKKELEEIQKEIKIISKWGQLKKLGKDAVSRGEPTNAFTFLYNTLKEKGVFLVPVGELENFVKEVGGHGPDWVNNVLLQFGNLDEPVYDKIKVFIEGMDL